LQIVAFFETMHGTTGRPPALGATLRFATLAAKVSSVRSATRSFGSGQKEFEVKKLYVGNLPFSAAEEQLQEWLGQLGVTASAISLIRDRFTGQSRGFAFVEIASDEEADRAINSLNGQNFGGRNLVVNEARPQTERSGGGGGRGGYGGGGGGGRGGDRGGRGGGGGRGGDRGDRGDRGNRW
jgi:cold-inducible RNA-binding protein